MSRTHNPAWIYSPIIPLDDGDGGEALMLETHLWHAYKVSVDRVAPRRDCYVREDVNMPGSYVRYIGMYLWGPRRAVVPLGGISDRELVSLLAYGGACVYSNLKAGRVQRPPYGQDGGAVQEVPTLHGGVREGRRGRGPVSARGTGGGLHGVGYGAGVGECPRARQ